MKKNVTVVIPALNEEGNLTRLLFLLSETFKKIGYKLPVLIIDDGSNDYSLMILEQLLIQYRFLKVVRHKKNLGLVECWKTALKEVETDWIIWGQADLESNPMDDIPLLLEAWKPGVDAVAGWRQGRKDGKNAASGLANSACKLIFGLQIHDMNWIKLVRKDLLERIPLEITTHRYCLAVLAGLGYKVIETATPWYPRYSGISKFGTSRLFTSALDFIKLLSWWYSPKSKYMKLRPESIKPPIELSSIYI